MSLIYSRLALSFSLLIALLISPSFQLDTQDIYQVSSGANPGSCDAQNAVIRPALQEVIDMSQAAINDINTALKSPKLPPFGNAKKERLRVVRTLRTFYGIAISDTRLRIQDPKTATQVRDNFQKIIDFTKKGPSAMRIACNDKWLQPTDTILPGTGSAVDPDGTPISSIPSFHGTDFLFYDAGSKDYLNPQDLKTAATGTLPTRDGPCAAGPRAAFTMRAPRNIITFCPDVFSTFPAYNKRPARTLKSSARAYTGSSAIPTDGSAYLDQYYSVTSLLLHEMTHQLFGTDDEIGYGFAASATAKSEQEDNADTYALYALASFLNKYDWHTGIAGKTRSALKEI